MTAAVAREGVGISIPRCDAGIGNVIRTPASKGIIDGVLVQPYDLWPDDRGYFLEVVRIKQGLAAGFPVDSTQVSSALSYAGTIKAFHFHRHQTDLWVPMMGMFQIGLVDLRPDSPTYGVKNTLYAGQLKTWQVIIPPGVAHGYKVNGAGPGVLVYVTNRLYDPSDEGRIAYNDPSLAYDWETQYK